MEHLDLAGYITTPTHWTMPAFEQQDAIYLSNSRQMLEPILEETSEDEERAQNSWSQYEQNSNVWSSAESETGSVIRIEVTKDADSISERDFACPAKRARRSDECLHNGYTLQPSSLDDTVLLRRFQPSNNASGENSLERFLAYESQFGTSAVTRDSLGANSQQRSSTGSRRFDDFYSDSDSLSYHSLSRSSSLIQFESLERQLLQEQHSSLTSLGNSSPSLLSFEGACLSEENRKSSGEMGSGSGSGANSGCNSGNNSRRGSQSSLLRRFESSDGRLHQTYYDLDKLNFDETEESLRRLSISKSDSSGILAHDTNSTTEVKSDSESSTSSSSSSGKSILNACKPSIEDLTEHPENQPSERIGAYQRAGGKNSAENLSEDSGYCEPSTLKRSKSKSIPKNFEKFCEEDEFFTEHEHKAIEASNAVVCRADGYHDDDDDDDAVGGGDHNDSTNTHSKNSTLIEHDLCQTKIALDATFIVDMDNSLTSPSSTTVPTTEAQQPTWQCFDSVKNSHAREPPLEQQQQYQQQQLKQARSLAHSPSPVSDAGSTTSSASCSSANSFTWLPTQTAQPPKQQQQQQQQQLLLNNFPRYQRLLPESVDFCSEHLQNSLPEIRDASGSTFVDYFSQKLCAVQQLNGYAVDSLPKTNALAAKHAQRKCSLSDSDNSGSDSSATSASSPTTSTSSSSHAASKAKIQSSLVHNSGSCGRVASVPNELDKIGSKRSKRNKLKINKSASTTNSETASSESELTDEDLFDVNNARIRRSCSWSERRERNLQKFEGAFGKERRQELGDTPGQSVGAQSLGYMNASYQNLTLLDYSGRSTNVSKSQSNFKRSSMESRQSSGDYESIICKGNFLLDELSEIYDKNASILNDQQLDLTKPLTLPSTSVVTPPKPAPRQRKHSNSSYSDLDTPDGAEPEVQHVQLTIRKPPARQKHGPRREAPSSIVSESNEPLTFSSFGKTFDQDPTNLRTSYAQSLEKCNFDAKELSNADLSQTRSLPKRRFQSHAAVTKKRNLVSSTPNLNAFDPRGDDLEDDIYVSSAHTSMHQLPQNSTQKPLGILIPTGSRSSFSSKEVSFCPVVSKYSWQEQSSEECNEPSTSSSSTERQDDSTIHDKEEESDDELLDNADATVIYNTKENEMIATRYAQQLQNKQEQEERELQKEHELQKERELHKERELQKEREQQLRENTNKHLREIIENEECGDKQRDDHKQPQELTQELRAENIAAVKTSQDERATQSENEKLVSADVVEVASMPVVEPTKVSQQTTPSTITVTITTRASEVTTQSNEQQVNNNNALATPTKTTTPRPLSLHLPILSEPPTNRAHILYASQQLIDSLQHKQQKQQHRYEQEFSESVPPGRTQSAYNLNSRQQVENNAARASTRMSNLAVKCSETNQLRANSGVDQSGMKHYNNNNELVKSKFKADEKHPSSKGFLSRFANGFRFSLRRNKKKQLQQQQQLPTEQNGQSIMVKSEPPAKLKASAKSNGAANGTKQKSSKQNSPDFIYIPLKGPLPADAATTSNNSTHSSNESTTSQHVSQPASEPLVTGKPPLPKQPPRQVEKLVGPSQTIHPDHPQQQSAGQSAHYAPTEHGQIVANFMPNSNQFYTNAKPSTIDESFLDAERLYYDDFRNQLNSGMHANGRLVDAVSMDPNAGEQQSEADATPLHFSSPSRASVSQKTQMFNNMSNGRIYVKNTHQSGGSGAGCHGKIGLIETNLDTHETVISGKTRSLMELGPQQHQQRFKFIKRINANASGVGGGHNYQADLVAVDDDDDDDDDAVNIVAADGSIVVVKGSSPQAAGQIASVRRPHKSMEFLLDKENQKNVLTTSEESHGEQPISNAITKEAEFEFIKPVKPPRKKKTRRNLTWKKDITFDETRPAQTTDSSDSEYKAAQAEKIVSKASTGKVNKLFNQAKNIVFKNKVQPTEQIQPAAKQDSSFVELDKTLMRDMNSPRKIKSRYTLTVLSSPSPRTESDFGESDIPRTPCRETSRSCPSVVDAVNNNEHQVSPRASNEMPKPAITSPQDRNNVSNQLMASYTDQGFETGSNDMDSPIRKNARTETTASNDTEMPLFFKFPVQTEKPIPARRLSNSSNTKPSGYSTPVKGHSSIAATGNTQQQFNCSPIAAIPPKPRRRSIYEGDPRRSSVTMQVINEDHPMDQCDKSLSPNSIKSSQNVFFPKNFRSDANSSATKNQNDGTQRKSVFWITAGDFCVSIDINYNSNDRVRLLYDIFSQKSFETRELHFGIDDQKFPANDTIEKESILERLPRTKGSSHYWFSTGDLAVPFNGKFMTQDKVRRLFNFVSEAVAESGVLRFGVDRYEFSHIPEFSYSNPKLSLESNYSMLVGLQGSSNGLEGRSKYAWPSTMTSSTHANMIKTSDLDHSDFESEECNNSEMRLSFSPFDNNYFDMASLDNMTTPRSSDAMMSPEMFSLEYENEPLDLLFEENKNKISDQPQGGKQHDNINNIKQLSVPQMLHIIQTQQNKLNSVEKSMNSLSNYYANSANLWAKELEQLKGTPDYIVKLQTIVAEINNIGAETGFKNCSQQQLESFTYFLSRYADICVANCNKHMGIIQDALMEKRAILV